MKNPDLGQTIKELRNRKGLSQEELADLTQLSLRTIQRIENGENDARGDSLKRIAKALNVTLEELIDQGTIISESLKEDNTSYLILLNLSALSFLVYPTLGIITPLVLWWIKKNTVRNIDVASKRLINFQISWFILTTVIPFIMIILSMFQLVHFGISLDASQLLIGVITVNGVNILYIVFNTIRLYQNKAVIYQPAVSFIK